MDEPSGAAIGSGGEAGRGEGRGVREGESVTLRRRRRGGPASALCDCMRGECESSERWQGRERGLGGVDWGSDLNRVEDSEESLRHALSERHAQTVDPRP
eukprot:2710804-Rhodomonas_salina.1